RGPSADAKGAPTGVALRGGGGGDALAFVREGTATLIAPILPGEELTADFYWAERTQRLVIPSLANEVLADGRLEKESEPAAPAAMEDAAEVCGCFKEVTKATTCEGFLGDGSAACARTYAGDCKAILACAEGDFAKRPACAPGEANVGATGRCRKL